MDWLLDAGVLALPDGRIYDVEHDVAAEAYRLGRYDARATRHNTDD